MGKRSDDLMNSDEFIRTYGISEINILAKEYLRSGATQKSVSSKYNISVETLRKLLDLGVAECYIQKDFLPLMEEKSRRNQIRHYPKEASSDKPSKTEKRYRKLLQQRKEFIGKYDNEIINLHYMIDAYNDYGFEEEGAIPKSALLARLEELETRRERLESF